MPIEQAPVATATPILFISSRSPAFGAYVMSTDGHEVTPLSQATGAAYADWAPDGRRLVFDAAANSNASAIYIASLDPSTTRAITDGTSTAINPAWSPDGSTIAFAHGVGGIGLADVATGAIRTLDPDGQFDSYPAWSPEGTQLIFSERVGERQHIAVMNVDGCGLIDLTPGETSQNIAPRWRT